MKQIGIRHLKAKASSCVRKIAEERATYTVTNRGKAVAVLSSPDHWQAVCGKDRARAWADFLAAVDRTSRSSGSSVSARAELDRMRR